MEGDYPAGMTALLVGKRLDIIFHDLPLYCL